MRILCVDDNPLVRTVTSDLLRELGHDVTEAGGGEQALLRIWRRGTIDMLVTDIQMPNGPDGFELAAMARKDMPDLPVIYFTGFPETAPTDDLHSLTLIKPCSLGALEEAIASLT